MAEEFTPPPSPGVEAKAPQPPRDWSPPAERGRETPLSGGMISRAAQTIRSWINRGAAAQRAADAAGEHGAIAEGRPVYPSQVVRPPANSQEPWFGPGRPGEPTAPYEDVAGRRFDYQPGYNYQSGRARQGEGIGFDELRGLSYGCDLLRLAIETRKDQMCKVKWSILPKQAPNSKVRPKATPRCAEIEAFLKKPDGVHPWNIWLRELLEDMFVIDAAVLYRRRDRTGKPYALEVTDAATIQPLLDGAGRRPIHPNAAYKQINHGADAAYFTTHELTYAIRNPRSSKVYGFSQVEQILVTVNTQLRRALAQLQHFTEGNIPDTLVAVPESWDAAKIAQYQQMWDALMSDPTTKRRARFVPTGVQPLSLRPDGQLTDQFDEWLARVIMYAFSLPPFPFVRQQNRATAETSYDSALEEGLAPLMEFIKGIIDGEIAEFFGEEGLELVYDDIRKLDPVEQRAADESDFKNGLKSLDDILADRGQAPIGLPAVIFGIGPLGFMSVAAVKKCIDQGLDMPTPAPMDGMGAPPGADPLAGASPAVLAQLGVTPQGGGGEGTPPEDEEEEEGSSSASSAPAGPAGARAGVPPAPGGGLRANLARAPAAGVGAAAPQPGTPAMQLTAPTARDLAAVRSGLIPDPRAVAALREAMQRMH